MNVKLMICIIIMIVISTKTEYVEAQEQEIAYLYQLPFTSDAGNVYASRTGGVYISAYNTAGLTGYDAGHGTNRAAIDFAGQFTIVAARGGVVTGITKYGHCNVKIDHGDGTWAVYRHIDNIRVQRGQRVYPGTPLGDTALCGNTDGYHLHLEVRNNRGEMPIRFATVPPTVVDGERCPAYLICPNRNGYAFFYRNKLQSFRDSRTEWNFASGPVFWFGIQDLGNMKLLDGGNWYPIYDTNGDNQRLPRIVGPYLEPVSTDTYDQIHVTIARNADDCMKLFWIREGDTGFTAERSLSIDVPTTGSGTYIFDLSNHPQWNSNIIRLRLHPTCTSVQGAVNIKKIEFVSGEQTIQNDQGFLPQGINQTRSLTGEFHTWTYNLTSNTNYALRIRQTNNAQIEYIVQIENPVNDEILYTTVSTTGFARLHVWGTTGTYRVRIIPRNSSTGDYAIRWATGIGDTTSETLYDFTGTQGSLNWTVQKRLVHNIMFSAGWALTIEDGSDPILMSPPLDIDTSVFSAVGVTMAASSDYACDKARMFYQNDRDGSFTGDPYVDITIVPGLFDTFYFPLNGILADLGRIRLDLLDCNVPGGKGAILLDSVEFVNAIPEDTEGSVTIADVALTSELIVQSVPQPLIVGETAQLTLLNTQEPEMLNGFTFSFDCNGDGLFTEELTTPSFQCDYSSVTDSVNASAQIIDSNGSFMQYTITIEIIQVDESSMLVENLLQDFGSLNDGQMNNWLGQLDRMISGSSDTVVHNKADALINQINAAERSNRLTEIQAIQLIALVDRIRWATVTNS